MSKILILGLAMSFSLGFSARAAETLSALPFAPIAIDKVNGISIDTLDTQVTHFAPSAHSAATDAASISVSGTVTVTSDVGTCVGASPLFLSNSTLSTEPNQTTQVLSVWTSFTGVCAGAQNLRSFTLPFKVRANVADYNVTVNSIHKVDIFIGGNNPYFTKKVELTIDIPNKKLVSTTGLE